jgi:hypothetical protein
MPRSGSERLFNGPLEWTRKIVALASAVAVDDSSLSPISPGATKVLQESTPSNDWASFLACRCRISVGARFRTIGSVGA